MRTSRTTVTRWRHEIVAGCAIVLLSVLLPGVTAEGGGDVTLFQAIPSTTAAPPPLPALYREDHILRYRLVRIDRSLLDATYGPSQRTLCLNAFPDEPPLMASGHLTQRETGSTVFWGSVEGEPYSSVTLVDNGSALVGAVRTSSALLHIAPVDDGVHAVVALDPSVDDVVDGPPLVIPRSVVLSAQASSTIPADDGSTIDVMVVYTARARQAAGGEDALQAQIALAVEEMNQSLANSNVVPRIRLVHAAEVAYDDIGWEQDGEYKLVLDLDIPLERIVDPHDGYMDEVHLLRDTYRADLVSLIVAYEYGAPHCGIATAPVEGYPEDFESQAFSVVEMSCLPGLTLAHELGHSLGCGHDRAAYGGGAFPYSYGYVDPLKPFRTIMAYGSYPRIAYWSNPDVLWDGVPTGIHYQQPDAADNRRTINQTAPIAARFRSSVCPMANSSTFAGDSLRHGDEEGLFSTPSGVDIGPDGSVYVLDSGNGRVQRFDADGNLQALLCADDIAEDLYYPYDLAVTREGAVLVSDTYRQRVVQCSADGMTVSPWGTLPDGSGTLFGPRGIAAAPDGSVYVIETSPCRVRRFARDGTLMLSWGACGAGPGQFETPTNIAVAPNGAVYVADSDRVQLFSPTGLYLGAWQVRETTDSGYGWTGGLAVATDGSVWLSDTPNHRLFRLDRAGRLLETLGGCLGRADGQFSGPKGVAVNASGMAYIVDCGNHRVQTLQTTLGPIDDALPPWSGLWVPRVMR